MASGSGDSPKRQGRDAPRQPDQPGNGAPAARRRTQRLLGRAALLVGAVVALAVGWLLSDGPDDREAPPLIPAAPVTATADRTPQESAGQTATDRGMAAPDYVGAAACQGCHAEQHAAWLGSHHDLAMQHATPETVLGDFDDATFAHAGSESRFFRRDGRFYVRTDGPDGMPTDFEIRYAFGVDPLQQYLVEFPDGRLQALSIAWDARPAQAGGQRWFHLYPGEAIGHRDELHWTRRAQNWNFMCADCHSTDLRKGYDRQADTFATRWAELDVGCEACHGPASNHVAWAAARAPDPTRGLVVSLDQRRGVAWTIDAVSGNATRSTPATRDTEVEVCAQCHARRAQIAEGYRPGRPFLDHYMPALLEPPLYHSDGQQRDEVYTWGSFLQSRMHARGVTCSDCHEPHALTLRAPGDALCAQCHLPPRYATSAHHHHAESGPGSACVDCHMPATDYMVIDPRRDHSFRIPRPDLTAALGTPNACANCHGDRPGDWAAAAIRAWTGTEPRGYQRFAGAFDAAARGVPSAAPSLAQLALDATQPAIVRATAARALRDFPSPAAFTSLRSGLSDDDALVRLGSLQGLDGMPVEVYAQDVVPLLRDARRAVRLEAARLLAGYPGDRLAPAEREAFDLAAAEYVASQRYNADRPEAGTALGTFFAARGQWPEAERELRATVARAPDFAPAWVNLADLHRARGHDADAEGVLREALTATAGAPAVHHALGLALVRLGRQPEALAELGLAAERAPGDVRFAYVHAVALNSAGRADDALREVDRGLELRPADRDLLTAGALFARDAGDAVRAAAYAARLVEQTPDDPAAVRLLDEIRRAR